MDPKWTYTVTQTQTHLEVDTHMSAQWSRPDESDSDLSFFDGFEQDLCSVTLFDMTINDSEEVCFSCSSTTTFSVGANPVGIHKANSGGKNTDCLQTHADGSDTESWDGQIHSHREHPHSDWSVVSSRMGASVAEERGSDQEAQEEDFHTTPSAIFLGRGAVTPGPF